MPAGRCTLGLDTSVYSHLPPVLFPHFSHGYGTCHGGHLKLTSCGTDVLNRYPAVSDTEKVRKGGDGEPGDVARQEEMRGNTIHCMMYLFPRQFGLHNAFTSVVDHTQTSQRFQDYTLREEEIQQKYKGLSPGHVSIPKRLRGAPFHLVEKMQILHRRCSYSALLKHYCPVSWRFIIVHTVKATPLNSYSLNRFLQRMTS